MSTQIRCDGCSRVVNERSAGWTTIVTRKFDTPIDHDLCSPGCVRAFVKEEFPTQPDFAGTRQMLEDTLAAASLDDAIDHGLLDDGTVDDEFKDIDPELDAWVRSLPRGRLSHASRAADVIQNLRRERGEANG